MKAGREPCLSHSSHECRIGSSHLITRLAVRRLVYAPCRLCTGASLGSTIFSISGTRRARSLRRWSAPGVVVRWVEIKMLGVHLGPADRG